MTVPLAANIHCLGCFFGVVHAVCFLFLLRHFGHFLLRHFSHRNISVICLTVVLKLTVVVFISLYF